MRIDRFGDAALMSTSGQTTTDDVIQALTERAPIKVWSYLTTIFGDLAQDPDDEISGVVLSALTERIGIRPEAMRVALHRLRKDGWIVARKQGRNSLYRLSEMGLAETVRASDRIYARKIERPNLWHLLVADPASSTLSASVSDFLERAEYLKVSENFFLSTGVCDSPPESVMCVEFTRMTIPSWLRQRIVSADSLEIYNWFGELLPKIEKMLNEVDPLPVFDRATIRLLMIHHWRRVTLRHSPLAEMVHDDDWIGASCRVSMMQMLDHLLRVDVDDLIVGTEPT